MLGRRPGRTLGLPGVSGIGPGLLLPGPGLLPAGRLAPGLLSGMAPSAGLGLSLALSGLTAGLVGWPSLPSPETARSLWPLTGSPRGSRLAVAGATSPGALPLTAPGLLAAATGGLSSAGAGMLLVRADVAALLALRRRPEIRLRRVRLWGRCLPGSLLPRARLAVAGCLTLLAT